MSPDRRRGTPRRVTRPASALAERWTKIEGIDVFYRESPDPPDAKAMMHLHGFGLSGRYLLPTAELLSSDFHTLVPDLPGFGRSGRPAEAPNVEGWAHAAAAFLDDRGIESVTLVGNSMGCPVICEFAYHHPDRIDRAILVSPAGGINNQPLRRAIRQLAIDGVREPRQMIPVAVPDYLRFGVPSTLRMFRALTQYPSLDRLLALRIPTLAVIGNRDPLMPGPARIEEVAGQTDTLCFGRGHRRGSACHQLQPPGRVGQRDPPLHGRQADRGRPGLSRPRHRVRDPSRHTSPAPPAAGRHPEQDS